MAFGGWVLTFTFLYFIPVQSAFMYEDCSTQDNILQLPILEVFPDPVDMSGNITVIVRGLLLRDIPESSKLEVKFYGVFDVFGMPLDILIPCIFGKYGSCTYTFCEYMEKYKKEACAFLANVISCECPLKAGSFGGEEFQIELGEHSFLMRILARGKYRTEMRLTDTESGKELACFKFHAELT